MASAPEPPRERREFLQLATGMLPILTAVGGALWGLFIYIDHQRESEKIAAQQSAKDSRSRLIEAQRPFLVKQLDLYFEAAQIAGKLVSLDPATPEWKDSDRRFWALYWSELSMVEHKVVEAAMVNFGTALRSYEATPDDEQRTNLQSKAYRLAHAIRSAIESAWGGAANDPQGTQP